MDIRQNQVHFRSPKLCIIDIALCLHYCWTAFCSNLAGLLMMGLRDRGLLSQWWKMSLGSWFPHPGKMRWLELLEQYEILNWNTVTKLIKTLDSNLKHWFRIPEYHPFLFDSCKELKERTLLLLLEVWSMRRLSFPWKTCWTIWIVTTCALRRRSPWLEQGKKKNTQNENWSSWHTHTSNSFTDWLF